MSISLLENCKFSHNHVRGYGKCVENFHISPPPPTSYTPSFELPQITTYAWGELWCYTTKEIVIDVPYRISQQQQRDNTTNSAVTRKLMKLLTLANLSIGDKCSSWEDVFGCKSVLELPLLGNTLLWLWFNMWKLWLLPIVKNHTAYIYFSVTRNENDWLTISTLQS